MNDGCEKNRNSTNQQIPFFLTPPSLSPHIVLFLSFVYSFSMISMVLFDAFSTLILCLLQTHTKEFPTIWSYRANEQRKERTSGNKLNFTVWNRIDSQGTRTQKQRRQMRYAMGARETATTFCECRPCVSYFFIENKNEIPSSSPLPSSVYRRATSVREVIEWEILHVIQWTVWKQLCCV